MSFARHLKIAAGLSLICFAGAISAATYNVGSIADLNTRIGSAVAGDIIVLSNGVYSSGSAINITKVATAANPIIIRAQTIGGVEITGSKSFTLSSPAAYITIQGFKFTHSGSLSVSSGTSHCRFTRNIIELAIPSTNDVSYINISGDDVQIDHNELRNKSTLGEMLDIAGSGSQVARRLWVHHNYFHDFTSPGGNGAETIRWGLSGLSLSTGAGLCEYNLFVRCEGENEMISNKSSGNTYRFNTVIDCAGGEISQRHGNDCMYYGNYMRRTQGMRIYGDRHRIFANYFESNSVGVNMGNGDGDVYNGAALTAHDRPDDNIIVFNTFVGNGTHYEMGGRTGGLGSSNTVVANNIFLGGGSIASISGSAPYTGTWTNNIRWNTSSAGNMPASGYTTVNPLLATNASGVFHVQAGSPAINAGRWAYNYYGIYSSFTFMTNDMDGQPRDGTNDIGADEFSAAPVAASLLTTNDVGPLSGLTNGNFSLITFPASQIVSPGSVASYGVTATFAGGFTNTVIFGVTGLPANTAASFSPAAVTTSTNVTLTVTTSNNTPQNSYLLTIQGGGGGTTNTAVVTLIVNSNIVAAPGILLWAGTGANGNWPTPVNWTNITAGGTGAPGVSNDVLFANNAMVAGSNTITSVLDGDRTIQSLTFTNNGGFHTMQINPGCTLTIVGVNGYQNTPSLNVGMDVHPATPANVFAGITGIGGTLNISNLAAAVQVRQGFGSGLVGATATLDMSGLGTFNADLRRFQIGSESGTPRRVAGVVYLARTNVITLNQALDVNTTNWSSGTPALVLGHNTQAGNTNGSQLFLGIDNSINVNQIVCGRGNQTNNLIAFNPAFFGSSPSVTFRGSDGVSRVGQWSIGDNSAGSIVGVPSSGTNDFTGGKVDALVDRLLVGRGRNGNTVNTGIGVLTFDAGTIDVNVMRLGTMVDESSSTNASGVGIANVNGNATLIVNTVLELAHTNTTAACAPAAVAAMSGSLNVNGGTVVAHNIVAAGGSSMISLNGGTLDLKGMAGSPGAPLTTFSTTNSLLHFNLDALAGVTNLVATTLNAAGFNLIVIDSVSNLDATQTFPVCSYAVFNGSLANFTLSDLPEGISGGLVNNTARKTIDLVLTPSVQAVPQIRSLMLSGNNLTVWGTNGPPYGAYQLLAATNLLTPVDDWDVVTSGVFNTGGSFDLTSGLPVVPVQQFFRLRLFP